MPSKSQLSSQPIEPPPEKEMGGGRRGVRTGTTEPGIVIHVGTAGVGVGEISPVRGRDSLVGLVAHVPRHHLAPVDVLGLQELHRLFPPARLV
jgi:hypothetical protein